MSQKRGWSIWNVRIPGEGSDIILLKLCSVFSEMALRNEGTKKFVGCMVYNTLCRGWKTIKIEIIFIFVVATIELEISQHLTICYVYIPDNLTWSFVYILYVYASVVATRLKDVSRIN